MAATPIKKSTTTKKVAPKKTSTKSMSTAKIADIDIDDGGKRDKVKEISRQGYQNLTNELQELKHVKMPAVVERIKEARSYGDLSENAEYDAALEEKNMIESRMMEIEILISDAVIIDESDIVSTKKADRIVRYGSTVTIEFEDSTVNTIQIVSTGEVGLQESIQSISFDSPIGAAIEGKKIGQTAKVRSERGRHDIKIINIA